MAATFLAKREAHAQPLLSIGFGPTFRNENGHTRAWRLHLTAPVRSLTSQIGVQGEMQVTGCHRGMQKLDRPTAGLVYCRAPWKTAAQSYQTDAGAGPGRPAVSQTWQLSSVYNGAHDMATTNAVFWDQHWRL